MTRRTVLLVLAMAAAGGPAAAQAPEPLYLHRLLEEVAADSPEVAVRRGSVEVAAKRVGVAGAWADPTVQVMVEDIRTSRGDMEETLKPMTTYQFSQPLNVLFGRRSAAKRAAASETETERAGLSRAVWDAKAEAFELFFELWMNGETRALLERQTGILTRMREAAAARYGAGAAMAHHEYLRSEAEIAALEAESSALGAERTGLVARINALRSRDRDAPLGGPVLPPRRPLPDLGRLLGKAEERPEAKAASAMSAAADAEQDLAFSEYYPMIMVGGGYQQRNGGEPDSVFGMVGFTVPLFWWDRQDNELAAARAAVTRAEREVQAVRIMTDAEVRAAWSRAWGVDRTLAALEDSAIPKSRETVASGEAEYVSGTGDYLRLLEAVTALLDLDRRRLELIVRREASRYELARILGTDIEETPAP